MKKHTLSLRWFIGLKEKNCHREKVHSFKYNKKLLKWDKHVFVVTQSTQQLRFLDSRTELAVDRFATVSCDSSSRNLTLFFDGTVISLLLTESIESATHSCLMWFRRYQQVRQNSTQELILYPWLHSDSASNRSD